MKKCPFCAEEIQDEAIKCKHCGEFLIGDAPTRHKLKSGTKWYYKPYIFIVGFLMVGPFALPLLWLNPQVSKTSKIIWTIVLLVLSYFLTVAFFDSLKMLGQYFEQLRAISGG